MQPGKKPLPITVWTDLGNKQPPFVKVTEGGIFGSGNSLINWNLSVRNDFSHSACIVVGIIHGKRTVMHIGQYLQVAFR